MNNDYSEPEVEIVETNEDGETVITLPEECAALVVHEDGTVEVFHPHQENEEVMHLASQIVMGIVLKITQDQSFIPELLSWLGEQANGAEREFKARHLN